MSFVPRRLALASLLVAAAAALGVTLGAGRRPRPAPTPPRRELQWPRVVDGRRITFSIYQPQIDKSSQTPVLEARAAVKVDTTVGDKTQTSYGVIWITATAFIDKENELVELIDIQITQGQLPDRSREDRGTTSRSCAPIPSPRARSPSAASRPTSPSRRPTRRARPSRSRTIRRRSIYRSTPAILVLIDGDPALRPVEGVRAAARHQHEEPDPRDGRDVTISPSPTPGSRRRRRRGRAGAPRRRPRRSRPSTTRSPRTTNRRPVDLMEEPGEEIEAVLAEGKAPEIIVSTVPAELLVTQGKPQMKPIGARTSSTSTTRRATFPGPRRPELLRRPHRALVPLQIAREGPVEFRRGRRPPERLREDPDLQPQGQRPRDGAGHAGRPGGRDRQQHPADGRGQPRGGHVRSPVRRRAPVRRRPGHVAAVRRQLADSGRARLPDLVLLGPGRRLVHGRIAGRTRGRSRRPCRPSIYTIPTASPIHYVTYVRVYRYTPTIVWFGYTPGYLGTCYSPWGTVVYGTGFYYRPWIGSYWYGNSLDVGIRRRHLVEPVDAGGTWASDGEATTRSTVRGGARTTAIVPCASPATTLPTIDRAMRGPMPYRPASINITNINVYNRPGIARPGVRPVDAAGDAARQPSDSRPAARSRPGTPTTRPVQPSTQPSTRPGQPATRPGTTQPARGQRPGRSRAAGQRLRGPGRQRVPATAGKAGKLGDQRQGNAGNRCSLRGRRRDPPQPARRDAPGAPSQPSTRPAPSRPSAVDPARSTSSRATSAAAAPETRG